MYAEYQQVAADADRWSADDVTNSDGMLLHASERPSLACLTTSSEERVERKRWTPLSLC
jgi:hypothetical protein